MKRTAEKWREWLSEVCDQCVPHCTVLVVLRDMEGLERQVAVLRTALRARVDEQTYNLIIGKCDENNAA